MANTATSIYSGTNSAYVESSETFTFTGDFTVEFWYYAVSHENANYSWFYELGDHTSSSSPYGCAMGVYQQYLYHYGQTNSGIASYNTNYTIPGGDAPTGRWDHFAHVYSGGKFLLYENGVLRGVTGKSTIKTYSGKLRFGDPAYGPTTEGSTAYYDEIRASRVARYGNIDVPTTLVSSTQTAGRGKNTLRPEHVSFLIQSNTTMANSASIVDRTGKNVVTVSGAEWREEATSGRANFGNCAIFFDGDDDYLELPRSDLFDVSDGQDFSYECWFYRTATSAGNHGHFLSISADSSDGMYLAYRDGASPHDIQFNSSSDTSDVSVYAYPEGTTTAGPMYFNWNHIVCGKVNGQNFIMLNGQLEGHAAQSVGFDLDGTAVIRIGRGAGPGWDSQYFEGYMDGMRFCKGQSAYTPHFTPYGGQKNVLHNRGGAVTDARLASANTNAIQMGRAAIGSGSGTNYASNANTYCLDFDGTADYLLHYNGLPDDTSGSFFAWVYLDVTPDNNDTIYWSNRRAGAVYYWRVEVNANGKFGVEQRASDTVTAVEGPVVSTGAWHSIGVTSDGTSYVFHLDGTASTGTATSGTDNGDWYGDSASQDMQAIGVYHATNGTEIGGYFNGKIMQVGLWSGTFSNTVMAALHSAGKGADLTVASGVYTATEIGTQRAYWRMGNHYLDTPSTIYDASGNGYDMHEVSDPTTLTYDTGTTFHENWQHRGYFDSDKYTSLLIQSSAYQGSTNFNDRGPGFNRVEFDGTDDVAIVSSLGSYRSSDSQGSLNLWVKPATGGAFQTMLLVTDSASTSYYLNFRISSGNKLQLIVQWDGSNSVVFEQSGTVSFGAWHMYTITCDTNGYKLYIDGSEDTSAVMTTEYGDSNWWFSNFTSTKANRISLGAGAYDSTMHYFEGQMSQVGIWGGSSGTTGVLSASEISAIYALGPDGNVKTSYSNGLVDYWTMGNLISDGTASQVDIASKIFSQVTGGNDLTTSGTMAAPFAGHTITRTGAIHSTTKSVFGGSSMYFDGTDDYLSIPTSADFRFGTSSSFTVEFWLQPDGTIGTAEGICSSNHSGTNDSDFYCRLEQGKINWYNSGDHASPTTGDFVSGIWYHVAFVRDGGTMTCFKDGIELYTFADTYDYNGDGEFALGARKTSGTFQQFGQQYLDEFRVSTGIARYTKSIERFANTFVAKGDTGDKYTYLQLNSNGAKHGASFSDTLNRTGFGTTAMTIGAGNPIWRNTKGDPYGGANTALYFDGASYLTIADNGNHDFADTLDATFEVWVNFESFPSGAAVIYGCGGEGHSGNPDGWGLRYNPSTAYNTHGFYFNLDWASPYTIDATGPADNDFKQTDRWYHCAVTKQGSLWSLYTDGVFKSSMTYSPAVNTATAFRMGYGHDGHSSTIFNGYIDGFRISRGIARYGGIQLRTTQQTHVSANADVGVLTSNSTFGSANNIFTADGHTAFLFTGEEAYSNTHVTAGGNKFLTRVGNTSVANTTTTYHVTVMASAEQLGGTSGNVYAINNFARPTLTLVRDNHYVFRGTTTVIGEGQTHPFRLNSSANGPAYTTGWVTEISGTDTLYKFSPDSGTPDALHYGCASHSNMGFSISVVDSTGSDGVIAPTPIGIQKGDGTSSGTYPVQRQGVSAYGANSYYMDGTNDYFYTVPGTYGALGTDTWRDNGFCGEIWIRPLSASTDGICSFTRLDASNHLHMRLHDTHGFVLTFDSSAGQVELLQTNNDEFAKSLVDQWHHIAAQITNADTRALQQLQLWVDGNLYASASMSDKHFSGAGGVSLYIGYDDSNYYYGYMDSFRVSVKERYNYSGTNAKLGTNAVHHSQAKLLITSNTYNGNTHFDDFSDQGNYWNQQPYGIYNHYSTEDWYIGTGTLDISESPAWTVAAWVKDYHPELSDFQRIFQYGTNNTASTRQIWLLRTQSIAGQYQFMSSTTSVDYSEITSGTNGVRGVLYEPTLVVGTFTNSGTENQKIYVNGILGATGAQAGNTPAFGGTNTLRLFHGQGESSVYRWQGYINQLAFWDSELSASQIQTMWENGPTGNWSTASYGSDLVHYWGMGNHDSLGGRPADSSATIFDRIGSFDLSAGPAPGTTHMNPSRGNRIRPYGAVKHSTNLKHKGSTGIFFDGDSDYLELMDNAIFDFPGNFTIEMWINVSSIGNYDGLITFDGTGAADLTLGFGNGDSKLHFYSNSGTASSVANSVDTINLNTWYHIAVNRSINRSNSVTTFMLNGILKSSGTYSTSWTTGSNGVKIGRFYAADDEKYFHGYMDEIAIYNGVAKYNPVATGLGTATVTPSYLPDPTGNHFSTASGISSVTDQMLDSPENNFHTWSPLHKNTGTFKKGNLQFGGDGTQWTACIGSMLFKTGKWYFESKHKDNYGPGIGSAEGNMSDGWVLSPETTAALSGWGLSGSPYTSGSNFLVNNSGFFYNFGTAENLPSGLDETDIQQQLQKNEILGFAFDLDNYRVKLFRNGNLVVDVDLNTTHTGGWYLQKNAYYYEGHGSYDFSTIENFGQGDPDGENNFTDSNNRGGFRFEPPQGYLACCTANMKDSEYAPIGPNSAAGTPDKHFDTLLYTGSEKSRSIGGLGFKPDFVWIKNRDRANDHMLYDSVRGVGKDWNTNDTSNEASNTNALSEFNADGFSLGTSGTVNYNNENHVAWCWKAGNDTTVNSEGTVTVTTSVNQDAGFSIIVGTTVNVEANDMTETFGHGLNTTPEVLLFRNLEHPSGTQDARIIFPPLTTTNLKGIPFSDAALFTNSTFKTGEINGNLIGIGREMVEHNGDKFVCYAWHSVEGYSKFGSWVGNNNADGPFIYLGFKPAIVIYKQTSAAGEYWHIQDNKRDTDNPLSKDIYPHLQQAEATYSAGNESMDFLSNGFKLRSTNSGWNAAQTYFYMAFAEMPFKYATAR